MFTFFTIPILVFTTSFIIAAVSARRMIRRFRNKKKGLIIFLASFKYLVLHILLVLMSAAIQTDMFCRAAGPAGHEGCGWGMFVYALVAFAAFPLGLIIFIVSSNMYMKKISLSATSGISPKWSNEERTIFFVSLIIYILIIMCTVPITKLVGFI